MAIGVNTYERIRYLYEREGESQEAIDRIPWNFPKHGEEIL